MQTIDAEGELFRANSAKEADHDEKEIFSITQLKEDFVVHRECLWFELAQEYDKRANCIETDTLCISTLARQEFLHELTQFAKFKQNQAPSPSQSTAVASFVFLAKIKQFCKQFLKFCTQNYNSEVNNNATINENEKVDLGKSKLLKFSQKSMDEFVLLTNQEEHL